MNFKRFATYMVAISVIALGVWACQKYNNDSLSPKNSNKGVIYQQTSTNTIEKTTGGGGGTCKVSSNCTGWTCSAKVTCGCDESPRCSCGIFLCECDCEAKEKISISIPHGQYDDLLTFSTMVDAMTSPASETIYQATLSYISAFGNNDYDLYLSSARIIESNLPNLTQTEKNTINTWFISIGSPQFVIN